MGSLTVQQFLALITGVSIGVILFSALFAYLLATYWLLRRHALASSAKPAPNQGSAAAMTLLRSPVLGQFGRGQQTRLEQLTQQMLIAVVLLVGTALLLIILVVGYLFTFQPLPAQGLGYILYWLHDNVFLPIRAYTVTRHFPFSLVWWGVGLSVLAIWLHNLLSDHSLARRLHLWLARRAIQRTRFHEPVLISARWFKRRGIQPAILIAMTDSLWTQALQQIPPATTTINQSAYREVVHLARLLIALYTLPSDQVDKSDSETKGWFSWLSRFSSFISFLVHLPRRLFRRKTTPPGSPSGSVMQNDQVGTIEPDPALLDGESNAEANSELETDEAPDLSWLNNHLAAAHCWLETMFRLQLPIHTIYPWLADLESDLAADISLISTPFFDYQDPAALTLARNAPLGFDPLSYFVDLLYLAALKDETVAERLVATRLPYEVWPNFFSPNTIPNEMEASPYLNLSGDRYRHHQTVQRLSASVEVRYGQLEMARIQLEEFAFQGRFSQVILADIAASMATASMPVLGRLSLTLTLYLASLTDTPALASAMVDTIDGLQFVLGAIDLADESLPTDFAPGLASLISGLPRRIDYQLCAQWTEARLNQRETEWQQTQFNRDSVLTERDFALARTRVAALYHAAGPEG